MTTNNVSTLPTAAACVFRPVRQLAADFEMLLSQIDVFLLGLMMNTVERTRELADLPPHVLPAFIVAASTTDHADRQIEHDEALPGLFAFCEQSGRFDPLMRAHSYLYVLTVLRNLHRPNMAAVARMAGELYDHLRARLALPIYETLTAHAA